jgi:regulator of protease activity HflC (stomatin/prohibitin superfamily)
MPDGTQEFVKLGVGKVEQLGELNQLLSPLGLVWVGFYKRYYKRTRRYEALEKKRIGSGWDVVSKERTDELFYWRTEMVAVIDGAETRDNFPVNVVVPFTTQILNPVRAEFLSGKWEVQATNGVRSAGRDHVETKLYNDLLRERDTGPDVLLSSIVKANTAYNLIDTFGVEIVAPRVESFDLSSANSEYAAATRLLGIKSLEADAAAEDARKIATIAAAEASAIAARAKAYRDGGVSDLVIADAIRDSKNISVLSINGGMPIAVTPPDRK